MRLGREKATGYAEDNAVAAADVDVATDVDFAADVTASGAIPEPEDGLEQAAAG